MITRPPKYAVDTCSLTALRRLYPRDLFAPIWDFVGDLADVGALCSVEEVLVELRAQDDEVLEWAELHTNMFYPLDLSIQAQAKTILSSHTGLYDYKKRTSSADPFLIALAYLQKATLVTEEKPSTGARPSIPDVCRDYGVECVNLLELLRLEGLRLRRA